MCTNLLGGPRLDVLDLVNLALHHAIGERGAAAELPPVTELAAFHKLPPEHQVLSEAGTLRLIELCRADAEVLVNSLM